MRIRIVIMQAVFLWMISRHAGAQLYGVSGSGTTRLFKVDTLTGQANPQGPNTGLLSPSGLAGDPLVGGLGGL